MKGKKMKEGRTKEGSCESHKLMGTPPNPRYRGATQNRGEEWERGFQEKEE